ncbi:uracil-DNA glycosylase, family 4 [Treponema sp. JC4]|uniref:uracil-DNA glycosylase n=1 Tax=Treponema sp. JC4 TaxID=1124982 RepID=UPI00025B052E|nr:uracil-DNA glycosylase [Treponema sp. JC4]EID85000.1 uracil-DNA glycosylase, family 4 [Treponema sp. JC4]
MKASEKELIFNLLKNASAQANGGFVPSAFANKPIFEDDDTPAPEMPSKIEASAGSNIQAAPSAVVLGAQSDASPLTIESIASKILKCTHCQLARTRTNVVPGEGVPHPEVLVIGEGPGYDEDMQGRPFVGKAGILLDKMLGAIGLSRTTNCFIANVVKCRPPQNRDPFPEEQEACFSFLEAQIKILKPKMILCMGRISAHKMLNSEEAIGKLRGQFFEFSGIPLMATYHPSALLRNQDLKRPAWEDLKKFRQKLDTLTGGNQ